MKRLPQSAPVKPDVNTRRQEVLFRTRSQKTGSYSNLSNLQFSAQKFRFTLCSLSFFLAKCRCFLPSYPAFLAATVCVSCLKILSPLLQRAKTLQLPPAAFTLAATEYPATAKEAERKLINLQAPKCECHT